MFTRLKLSHRYHSGRLRPHEYTSYIPLILLLLIVGLALTIGTVYADHPGPQADSVSLTGIMPQLAPTKPATIQSPTNGQKFDSSPIKVTGTCPSGTIIEIFKNDIFAGSGVCTDYGTFSVEIDLMFGNNVISAKDYDALNQAGPDSPTVSVYYNALPAQSSPFATLDLSGAQLLLTTDAVYRGVFPDQQLNVPINVIGGIPPYAINIDWGDSDNNVVPRNTNTTFNVSHKYKDAGTYQITIQGSDVKNHTAFLTVLGIVNGQPAVATSTATTKQNKLIVLWPLYASALAIVISFWLGEKREKRILNNPRLTLQT